MNTYKVKVNELITHEINIVAATEDSAVETAIALLSNVPEEQLLRTHHYEIDGEFTGHVDVELLED